jgi:hypothetical protein
MHNNVRYWYAKFRKKIMINFRVIFEIRFFKKKFRNFSYSFALIANFYIWKIQI